MRQFLLAALLIGGSALVPASAQYYDYPPRGYEQPGYGYGYGPPRRPRVRPSNVCITARGPCPIETVPQGTPCQCFVPGFGYKRGNAG